MRVFKSFQCVLFCSLGTTKKGIGPTYASKVQPFVIALVLQFADETHSHPCETFCLNYYKGIPVLFLFHSKIITIIPPFIVIIGSKDWPSTG